MPRPWPNGSCLEGVFVLKTNLPKKELPAARGCCGSTRNRAQVERRIHHLKGPLAVAPMFLEKPETDRRAAVHPGVGVDGLGADGAAGAAQPERQADVWPVSGESPSPAPTGPALLDVLRHAVHRDHQTSRRDLPTAGRPERHSTEITQATRHPARTP